MSADVLLLAVIVAAFYLLILAPMRNRKKRAEDIKAHLKPGAEVMTTSGMFGTVTATDDEFFWMEISPGVTVKFVMGAVGKINVPKDEASDEAEDEQDVKHDGDDPPTKRL